MTEFFLKKANDYFKMGDYYNALYNYYILINNHPYFEKILNYNVNFCRKKIEKKNNVYRYFDNEKNTTKIVLKEGFDNWLGWYISNEVKIYNDGVLRVNRNGEFQCAIKREIPLVPGRFYQVDFEFKTTSDVISLYWIVRNTASEVNVNYYDDNQAPIVFHKGSLKKFVHGRIIFRTFCDTKNVDLYLFAKNAYIGDLIEIKSVDLTQLKPKQNCNFPFIVPGEKIIASLASIPSREKVLRDVVGSLYYQVDEIRIFLNGYRKVPSFLINDTKIKYVKSDIWGDNGDAGKFFWADENTPGYRLICDDDIIYPVDYAQRMICKLKDYKDKVVVGLHGILLKQPIENYYGSNQRSVSHYRNAKVHDYSCHILGTGAIAYRHGVLKFCSADFHYRNMGDIWFAKFSQEQKVPLVRINSNNNWVMPQSKVIHHSIYDHSTKSKSTNLNTADIQTAIVKDMYPVTIFPREKSRLKVIYAVKTYNRLDYLKQNIHSFLSTCNKEIDWVVIIADDGSTDGTLKYLDQIVIPYELHVLKNNRKYAVGQTNTIFKLSEKIEYDYGFCVDDDLIFKKNGWDSLYINGIKASGYSHLVHRHLIHAYNLGQIKDPEFKLPNPAYDFGNSCVAYGDAFFDLGTGSLITFTSDTIKYAGYCDEENFPIRGQWHVDYHIRCCRVGCNDINNLFDVVGSNDYIEIQNYESENYCCAIPWNDEYKKTKDPKELERRYTVMRDENRTYIPPPSTHKKKREGIVNSFFDKIYVLNLDRRPDRWENVLKSAKALGVQINRFSAFDGTLSPYIEQFQLYSKKAFVKVPDRYAINSNYEFYRNYPTDMSRVAYFEKRNNCKAIGSPGAWGYLLTMISILEDALYNGYEQILVLDDDVIFHSKFNSLFKIIIGQIPNDWKILQLGALQYQWGEKWIDWYSDNLYMCNGCSIGSHAVGMHRSIIPLVLNFCRRFDLPYDEGPLHKPKALYPKKCLTFFPNLLIQDVSESDISDTTGQKRTMLMEKNTYRWELSEYLK